MTTKPNSALNRLNIEKNSDADAKFCCCEGNKCNVNVTTDLSGGIIGEEKTLVQDYYDWEAESSVLSDDSEEDHSLIMILLAIILGLIFVTLSLAIIMCR